MVVDAARDGDARPDQARWSVAEIIEHLTLTYSGTAKGFERCVETGAPLASAATAKQRLQQFLVISLGYFPVGRKAPKQVVPTGRLQFGAVLASVRRDLARLDDAAAQARLLLGRGKMLDHPILGALTVDQWLKFHRVHTRHHAVQIKQRRRPERPSRR